MAMPAIGVVGRVWQLCRISLDTALQTCEAAILLHVVKQSETQGGPVYLTQHPPSDISVALQKPADFRVFVLAAGILSLCQARVAPEIIGVASHDEAKHRALA